MTGDQLDLLEDWANRTTAEALSFKPNRPRHLGSTFAERDDTRTETQYTRLCFFLSASPKVKFTLRELADGAKGSEAGVSARFREMRANNLPVQSEFSADRGCWVYWYQPKDPT